MNTPSELADRLVAEQIARLPAGGRYSVVSNPRSWRRGEFSRLYRETELAVTLRRVHVRRIFVLADRGPHAHGISIDAVREVIEEHLDAARDWANETDGRYEVRLYDADDRERLQYLKLDAAEQIFQHHYGIIEYQKNDYAVEVKVDEPDLSAIYVGGLPAGSRELQRFELVWAELAPVTGQRLNHLISQWEERLRIAEQRSRGTA